jgi:hypothetical protein
MLLRLPRRLLGWLYATTLLCWSAGAQAQVQGCIASNNEAADLRSQHHLLAARDGYLACASASACPAMVREECGQALTELNSTIPTLIIAVVDDQKRDLSGVTLTLDGKALELTGSAVAVDPGSHTLVALRGALRAELTVMASESELNRRVELVLAAPPPEAPPPSLLLAAPIPPARSHTPSYVLGGVAAVAAGSFAVFALSGHAQLSQLASCKPYCEESDVHAVQTKYVLADVSLGVSLLALGAATYLWLRPAAAPRREHAALGFDVAASSRGAQFAVRWRQ